MSEKIVERTPQEVHDNIVELLKENKQLKERVAYLERSNNRREDTIMSLRSEQQLDLYKEVIEEVREYINHEWFKRGQLGIIDKSFQEWQLKDILQILDKVGDNNG